MILEFTPCTLLDEEAKTFNEHKSELLEKARGQYVLIKKDQIIGTYPTRDGSLKEGFSRYFREPFFIKYIDEEDRIEL